MAFQRNGPKRAPMSDRTPPAVVRTRSAVAIIVVEVVRRNVLVNFAVVAQFDFVIVVGSFPPW